MSFTMMGIKRSRFGRVLLLVLGIMALVLLAMGLSELELLPGKPFSLEDGRDAPRPGNAAMAQSSELSGFWRVAVAVFIWIIFPISLIYFIISPEARKRVLRDLLWVLSVILMIYLFISAFKRLPTLSDEAGLSTTGSGPPAAAPLAVPDEFISQPPQWFVFIVSLGLISLAIGALWLLWRRSRTRETTLERLAAEAEGALAGLRTGADLKDVVMRCYFEMNKILSEGRGLRRAETMTPREFERYLEEAGLRDEHIRQLTELFENVRYGAKAPTEREERAAEACLEMIVKDYGRPS